MKIGDVIRKYRKAKNLTQEEMATCLGVTTPAVNKWESGSTMPDIALLAPISRLLGVTLDELLSYQEELTEQEIRDMTERLSLMLETEDFDGVFAWAKKQIETYPNCEVLMHSFAVMLYCARQQRDLPDKARYDGFVLSCYERLLKSNDEKIRLLAANSLFDCYFREEQYDKAQQYLSYLSEQNPDRKRKQALLYERRGEVEKAYATYEEILFSSYQMLSFVLNSLFIMETKGEDYEKAEYYAEKKKELVRLFEMGEYNVFAADLEMVQFKKDADRTIACIRGLLDNVDSLYAFAQSPLYAHMTFRQIEPRFFETVKRDILQGFKADEVFSYMSGDPRWEALFAEAEA